jgi:hypothetical protein
MGAHKGAYLYHILPIIFLPLSLAALNFGQEYVWQEYNTLGAILGPPAHLGVATYDT